MSRLPDGAVDAVIIGAGLAGATAGVVLGRAGLRVVLVDSRSPYPTCFKAEKIEPDQAEVFRKFGLLDPLRPWTARIREVRNAHAGRLLDAVSIEQYGVFYHDMVNEVRRQLPPAVDFRIGLVDEIVTGAELQRVVVASGDTITARLVVLAGGTSGRLHDGLRLRKRMIRAKHSVSFGFTIARDDGRAFPFDALTYYADVLEARIDYLTLFPIRDVMRANLFTYRDPKDAWVRRFIAEPRDELRRALPGLTAVIGEFRVVSKVETGPIDLYVVEGHRQPGVVLIADAFQSVCPATGTGLSKVLTDVDLLCTHFVPRWLSTPGMGADKIASFYDHPRKIACDHHSLESAAYRRQVSTDASLRWSIHRRRVYFEHGLRGWRERMRMMRRRPVG